jgi:hypothetical protein
MDRHLAASPSASCAIAGVSDEARQVLAIARPIMDKRCINPPVEYGG